MIVQELVKYNTLAENHLIVFGARRDGLIRLICLSLNLNRMTVLIVIKKNCLFFNFFAIVLGRVIFCSEIPQIQEWQGLKIWICLKIVLYEKESVRLMSFVSVCSLYKFRAFGHAYLETIIIACVSEVKDFSLCLSAALQKVGLLAFSNNFAVKFILQHICCAPYERTRPHHALTGLSDAFSLRFDSRTISW